MKTTNGEVLAYICREDDGIMCAVGPSAKMFTHMVHVFDRWNYEDPKGFDDFRDILMAALNIAGRDLDKEALNHETKNSAA